MKMIKLLAVLPAFFAMFLIAGSYSTLKEAKLAETMKTVRAEACINRHVANGHPREVIDISNDKCLIAWKRKQPKPWGLTETK